METVDEEKGVSAHATLLDLYGHQWTLTKMPDYLKSPNASKIALKGASIPVAADDKADLLSRRKIVKDRPHGVQPIHMRTDASKAESALGVAVNNLRDAFHFVAYEIIQFGTQVRQDVKPLFKKV